VRARACVCMYVCACARARMKMRVRDWVYVSVCTVRMGVDPPHNSSTLRSPLSPYFSSHARARDTGREREGEKGRASHTVSVFVTLLHDADSACVYGCVCAGACVCGCVCVRVRVCAGEQLEIRQPHLLDSVTARVVRRDLVPRFGRGVRIRAHPHPPTLTRPLP